MCVEDLNEIGLECRVQSLVRALYHSPSRPFVYTPKCPTQVWMPYVESLDPEGIDEARIEVGRVDLYSEVLFDRAEGELLGVRERTAHWASSRCVEIGWSWLGVGATVECTNVRLRMNSPRKLKERIAKRMFIEGSGRIIKRGGFVDREIEVAGDLVCRVVTSYFYRHWGLFLRNIVY